MWGSSLTAAGAVIAVRVCPTLPAGTFCSLARIYNTQLVKMDLNTWIEGTNVEGSVQILS